MRNKTTYNRSMHDRNNPYTPISAKLINNTELTGEERFLLIFLLGRSNDYILNSSYFAQKSQELFGWGRDKFQKIWNNLQEKGYITKEQMRDNGLVAGYHYKVNEVLKNRIPENPCTGKSGFRQTSALPSIDKPIIDKPITDELTSACGSTMTNLYGNGVPTIPAGGPEPLNTILKTNDQVKEIFKIICEENPSEYSDNWRLNDQDRKLIARAINEFGFVEAQIRVYKRMGTSEKPYTSASYIFSDLKEETDATEDESNVEEFLKKNPKLVEHFVEIELSDEKVEKAQHESEDGQQFFEFIRKAVMVYHEKAKHWKASDEDLEYCERLLSCDSNIPLAEKLRSGLISAFQKNEWRFGQIVYQAMTAIETREVMYH